MVNFMFLFLFFFNEWTKAKIYQSCRKVNKWQVIFIYMMVYIFKITNYVTGSHCISPQDQGLGGRAWVWNTDIQRGLSELLSSTKFALSVLFLYLSTILDTRLYMRKCPCFWNFRLYMQFNPSNSWLCKEIIILG